VPCDRSNVVVPLSMQGSIVHSGILVFQQCDLNTANLPGEKVVQPAADYGD